jgi:hypothetical protein
MESFKNDNEGYIYCLTNECMPSVVKIGMTLEDPELRAKELSSSTGVPTPFQVAISKRIVNPREKEHAIHELLTSLGFRVNDRREFFDCSMTIVKQLFAVIDGVDMTVNTLQAMPAVRKHSVTVVKLNT